MVVYFSITIYSEESGGFLGFAKNCTFTNCSIEAVVYGTGARFVGGFGGRAENSTINNVNANITIISNASAGGLFAVINTVSIENAKVTGNVTGTTRVAGFVASVRGTNNFTNCTYYGDMEGETNIGGIASYLNEGSSSMFISCSTHGKIMASGDYVGGIVGVSQGPCIAGMKSCSHFGDIEAGSYVGGLIGKINSNNASQPSSFDTYELHYKNDSKGLRWTNYTYKETIENGVNVTVPINNCVCICNIMGKQYTGGLIGYETISIAEYTYSTRTISVTYSNSSSYYGIYLVKNGTQIGSAVSNGQSLSFTYKTYYSNNNCLAITNNYYSGSIEGTSNVAGLVGFKDGGILKNNYSYATIHGEDKVGGLAGDLAKGTKVDGHTHQTIVQSNVSNNFSIVATQSSVGRIYGISTGVTIGELGSNDSNRSSTKTKVIKNGVIQEITDDLQNGTSVGPTALKTKANYQAWGWDFDNDWNIIDGESWPYKKYQTAPPSIESPLVSQETTISGKSINGGIVYLKYNNQEPIAINCKGEDWSLDVESLQSGATITIYAETDDLVPSYPVTYTVSPMGEGTEANPYQIYTAYDLQGISKRGYYKLMNDIDLSAWILRHNPSEGWKPIGMTEVPELMHLDGDGHKIKGLWTENTYSCKGLFANLSNGGSVKNLAIEVATGKKVQGGDFAGILAGYAVNVSVDNCLVRGDVETANYAGGLIGYATGGSITKCYTKGNVKATGDNGFAGGLVAWCSTPISNCYSTANVEAPVCVAGLVGYSSSTIDKCYAQGNVSGLRLGAGVVAQLSGTSATITNSVALNEAITMTGEYASASRVLNGNIDGSPDPDESNLALKTMVVTINGKQEKKYDDEWEGKGKQLSDLMLANAYETLGWNFTNVWGIVENETVPYLLNEIKQGDVNRDGQIDMTDAVCIVYYYLGQHPKVFLTESADMNGDGRIDITDAIIIVYQYLGENGNGANARMLLEETLEKEPQ